MFGKLFGGRATTRTDVAMAVTGALFAVFKAYDTSRNYKLDQEAQKAKENHS